MNFDLFWPSLSPKAESDILQYDLELIKQAEFQDSVDTKLSEARRLYDQEQQRRSSADSKAGLYLGIATAFLASIITLSPLAIDIVGKSGSYIQIALSWMMLSTMVASAIVALRCIIWSHDTLKVTSFHTMNWRDFVKTDVETSDVFLLRETLKCLCLNDFGTNEKLTKVKMSEALLRSAWFWLILSLTFRLIYHVIDGGADVTPIINVISICPERA